MNSPKSMLPFKKYALMLTLPAVFLSGCAELNSILQSASKDAPLTITEVTEGLKEALVTGSKNAAAILSAVDGYYGDQLVKILLPEEASVIIDNLSRIREESNWWRM